MANRVFRGVAVAVFSALLVGGCGKQEEAASTAAPSEPAVAEDRADTPAAPRRLMDSTAGQAEWSPEFTPLPNFNVTEALARAEQALAAGRLDQGENSALALYTLILQNEPENPLAQAGIDSVVEQLLQRGEQAFAQARFNESGRIVGVVARLRPDSPELASLRAKLDSGREVAALLAEAQRLADAGQLVSPEGSNAAEIYRQILRADPANTGAQEGLTRIEAQLVTQASRAAETGNFDDSQRMLADASRVAPGSASVQDASTRIVELRQTRANELIAQANSAVEAGNVEAAQQALAALESDAAGAEGIEALRSRIESARAYASLRPGQAVSDPLRGGGSGPELVVIPLGSFQMGSPENEPERKTNEGPRLNITLARGMAMARTETTVGQYRAFIQATGYVPSANQNGSSTIYDERSGSMVSRSGVTWQSDHAGRPAGNDLPVIHVSWVDAKAYTDWLSREAGKNYRLPSEAEFEYALRAGTQTRYPWGEGNPTRLVGNLTGDGDRSDSRRNWVNAFSNYSDGFWGPAPVRSYEANRFGLHDMAGNVSEWVEDCWHDNYQRAPTDGSAWVNPGCNRRVIRGGSWASSPDQARSAFRLTASPTTTNARLGFRVARDL